MTMSGLTTGILFTAPHSIRDPFFMEKKPIAANVPTTVENSDARRAMEKVTNTASMMVESVKTYSYHFNVKPLKPPNMLSLKENSAV